MIELHRHIGGSISVNTVAQITKLPKTHIKKQMLFGPREKPSFHGFLKKFNILDTIIWTKENIEYTIRQICWDIVREGIKYCELKLSIGKYIKHLNWKPEDIIVFVGDIIKDEESRWDISIGLVLSLKYESDRKLQKRFAKIITNSKAAEYIIGIDLVGDEEYYDSKFYKPIFKLWKDHGKGLQAHVGESQSPDNIRTAILDLKVDRIAHGIKATNNRDLIKLIRDSGVCLDIALTSNLMTGVIRNIKEHPIREFFDTGIPITIGTDDPVILNTNISKEYALSKDIFKFTNREIGQILENSVKYSFLKLGTGIGKQT
jgi:adenosine deaminase